MVIFWGDFLKTVRTAQYRCRVSTDLQVLVHYFAAREVAVVKVDYAELFIAGISKGN